jgi:F1F0 ATPase subunit 2
LVSLEVDAARMSNLSLWTLFLAAVHLAAGLVLGTGYFQTVRWTSNRLADGRGTAAAIASIIGRFVLLGGALTLISLEGAMPLLLTTLGILAARAAVLRRARVAA